jgi:hypothetical protein
MFIWKLSPAEAAPNWLYPPHQLSWLIVAEPANVNSAAACMADGFEVSPYQMVLRFGEPELYTVD